MNTTTEEGKQPETRSHLAKNPGLRNAVDAVLQVGNEDNSFSSNEYEKACEIFDPDAYKETTRGKSNLRLHDLARKKAKLLDRKIMNYPRLIIAIATFYVLPVIQLVLLYQTVSPVLREECWRLLT